MNEAETYLSSHHQGGWQYIWRNHITPWRLQGVDELSQVKLKDLIDLKYQSIQNATPALGSNTEIRTLFVGFQQVSKLVSIVIKSTIIKI